MECNTKISQYPIYGNGFDKTSVYKAKIPHFAYKYPAWHAGLRQSRGIFYAAEMAKSKIKSGTAHRQCRSLQRTQPFKYPPCCASSIGRVDLLMLFYHNLYKKKSQRVNVLPLALCTHFSEVCVLYFGRTNSISHIQHFFNAFQPVAYRRPAVMGLCCNVRQRKPLNVPQ